MSMADDCDDEHRIKTTDDGGFKRRRNCLDGDRRIQFNSGVDVSNIFAFSFTIIFYSIKYTCLNTDQNR